MPQLREYRRSSSPSNKAEDIERFSSQHGVASSADFFDPNLDEDEALFDLEEDSPYPEVRSAVSNADDPSMPASTIRAWFTGVTWTILISGMNQFFYLRYPTVAVSSVVAQLLSFPICRLWARLVPRVQIFGFSLNPGPFNIKEHVLITVMVSVGAVTPYAADIIAVQRVFYNENFSFAYQWMLVMSTQLIGFSIGGIARRFLVQPPSMIWPSALVVCALFNTLHHQQYSGIGARTGISRERFFVYAFTGAWVWSLFPAYLFQALRYFNWICWIVPNNVVVNQLFGTVSGLGMSVLTFDWAQVAFIGSPLVSPWWSEANILASLVFFFWFLAPILYYTNTWDGKYLPISSSGSYDRFGNRYNVTRILNSENTLDVEAYKAYSPLFISTTFALAYGLAFASITATLTHTFLYYRKLIWRQARKSMREETDIHARLMARYEQVPWWWYAVIFLTMLMLGIISIEVWPTHFPVWAFAMCLVISFSFVIPVGMIQAITNQHVGLNVITELIIGYVLPGRPLAMMMFKTWGYMTMAQALTFTADFKLGHYMKVPPRAMFWAQVIATIIAGTVQLGVQAWMFSNIPDICQRGQRDGFICANTQVFGVASIIWGVLGPGRQISIGQVYQGLCIFFAIGFVAPVIGYFIHLKWPNSIIKYINFPVMFAGVVYIPPATAANYASWALIGFIFQYVIRRRYFAWWSKYNYVLSSALDAGTAFASIFIFFCLQYPKGGTIGANTIRTWWGNVVSFKTADASQTPWKQLAPGQTIGPETW